MGIPGPRDPDFVWNRCLCGEVFKGPDGRGRWAIHITKCAVMKAQKEAGLF